jgi:hypothetical protein
LGVAPSLADTARLAGGVALVAFAIFLAVRVARRHRTKKKR